MNASTTDKFALPFLQPGQALKTVTHNEALQRLDAGLYLSCSDMSAAEIPAAPAEGYVLVLSNVPADPLAEHAGDIGVFQNSSWHWFKPASGWTLWDISGETLRVFDGANWVGPLVNSNPENLPYLGLNSSATADQRLAVASGTSLFTHDGDSHRMAVNRAADADTASLIFQTDYSGRTEMGLTGADGFSLKTSSDGENWSERLSTPEDYTGVRAPSFGSQRITIGSHSAVFIPTPSAGGILVLTVISDTGLPRPDRSGLFAYDTGRAPRLETLASRDGLINHGFAVLDGTVSEERQIGVSVGEGGLYIENTMPFLRKVSLTFLC